MGRPADAGAVMEKAFALPGTRAIEIYVYGARRLAAGENEAAMRAFERNAKLHPEEKYWTAVGLARGYSAAGDKGNAIRQWEAARAHVPEWQKVSAIPRIEKALRDLEEAR
jgi:tetratricopeptide (TPR) repeat protein